MKFYENTFVEEKYILNIIIKKKETSFLYFFSSMSDHGKWWKGLTRFSGICLLLHEVNWNGDQRKSRQKYSYISKENYLINFSYTHKKNSSKLNKLEKCNKMNVPFKMFLYWYCFYLFFLGEFLFLISFSSSFGRFLINCYCMELVRKEQKFKHSDKAQNLRMCVCVCVCICVGSEMCITIIKCVGNWKLRTSSKSKDNINKIISSCSSRWRLRYLLKKSRDS